MACGAGGGATIKTPHSEFSGRRRILFTHFSKSNKSKYYVSDLVS